MSQGNMVYLRLYVQYEPPIIGILYKNKESDEKKKIYKILLQRLVLNPDPMEAAEQLYLQHPHMLEESRIPKQKIAALVQRIQKQLGIDQDYDEEQDHGTQRQHEYGQEYQQDEQSGEEQQHEQGNSRQQEEQHYHQPEPKKEPEVYQKKRPKFDFENQFGKDDGPLNRSL